MTELNTSYPATQDPPEASPGNVIHSYFDLSAYAGSDAQARYYVAETDDDRLAALREMPDATVKFYELPEGQPFFDTEDDRPRDSNGYAIWDTVWLKDIDDLGTIEAAYPGSGEYDVQTGKDLVRVKADKIKPLSDLTDEEDGILRRLAERERATGRAEASPA